MSRRDAARRTAVIRCAAALGIAFAAACGSAWAAGDSARGRAKVEPCVACHGTPQRVPLAGMPALAGQPAPFLELQLIMMREGLREVPQMTALMKGFSDGDISDIAAYYAGETPPPNPARRERELYARGAALAKAMICGNCHGEDFRGQKHLPRLAGQREDYLIASLKAYRENKRTGIDTSMNELMYRVTDSDIEALAHFLAHQ